MSRLGTQHNARPALQSRGQPHGRLQRLPRPDQSLLVLLAQARGFQRSVEPRDQFLPVGVCHRYAGYSIRCGTYEQFAQKLVALATALGGR